MPSLVKPRLEEEGQVFAYLQPMPPEADRLTFRLEGVSAVRGDGSAVPLAVRFDEVRGKALKRDRLLAYGNLPPGQYVGFSFRFSGATLKGEEGEIALPLTDEKPMTPFPFAIARRKAQVVSLRFRYRDSVPGGIRFAPVYVAIAGEDAVEAIDLLGGDVITRGPLTIGDRPEELALTPDRRTLLSANAGSSTVSVIDAASLVEIRRIRVGNGSQSILVDRAGRRAYVFNTLSNTVSVLDLAGLEVVATVSTESGPVRGEFNRAGNRLYVLHMHSPYLNVYDAATLSIVRRVYVGPGGSALKVDPRTDLVYLARKGTGEIEIYDPFSFLPVDAYRTGEDAAYLTIDGEGNNLCAVFPGANEVRMIRLIGKATASEVEVGEDPFRVTLRGER
jgi:YVTN family beta-propeller protein